MVNTAGGVVALYIQTYHKDFGLFSQKNRNMNDQPNNPLHGLTLEKILCDLVGHYGWDELYKMIEIRCFYNDPSIRSSLKFLRKTSWARAKIEEIYINLIDQEKKEL